MAIIHLETFITAPIAICFDLARSIDVHLAADGGRSGVCAIAGITSGLIGINQEVTWEATHFGLRQQMTSRIVEFGRPHMFTDEMQRGPFKRWRHTHSFRQKDGGTLMTDAVDYASPLGVLGRTVDALFLKNYMTQLLVVHNEYIKKLAQGESNVVTN